MRPSAVLIELVANKGFGDFGVSDVAWTMLQNIGYSKTRSELEQDRNNPLLIQVVKQLGPLANSKKSQLRIETYQVNYDVVNYDCEEWLTLETKKIK